MANGGRIDYTIGFKTDKVGLNDLKASLKEVKSILPSKLIDLNVYPGDSKAQMKQAMSDFTKMSVTLNEVEKAFDNAFDSTTGITNLQKLNQSLNSIGVNNLSEQFSKFGEAGQQAFYQITKASLTTKMQLKESTTLLDKLGVTFMNTIKWSISSSVINKFTGSIQQAYGYVQHLDSSLNDIRIVTNKSADEMDRFAVSANNAAQKLGAATTEYTEAALIYYQQGLGDEEAQARAETTLKAANVTGQTGREVSEELTAVWNGYKVTAEETELYVDKLAAVAATTASDLEELSTGMSKVASAANNMGVDVDQLNAQLATIISVTRQAPESAGTALKTIYARMEDLKISGEDEYGVKLGDVSSTLDEVGVHIMDVNGDMRDLGEVIEEVGNKWDGWTRAQQSAISQAIAGKRQYNNLLALFDNWDMYNEALETSSNSMGTLQKQQDIYMESTEAHLQQLKTAQEGLFDSLIDTKTINNVIDIFTKGLNTVENFIDGIGGGNNALLMLGSTAVKIFSKQFGEGIKNTLLLFSRLKNNAKELQAQIDNIQLFKNSSQYKDNEAVRALVDAQEQVSKYYGILNQEQINSANALAQQVGDAKALEIQWKQDATALNDYMHLVQQQRGTKTTPVTIDKTTQYVDFGKYDFTKSKGAYETQGVKDSLDASNVTVTKLQSNIRKLTSEYSSYQKATVKVANTQKELDSKSKKLNQIFANQQTLVGDLEHQFDNLNNTGLLKNVKPEKINKINAAFAEFKKASNVDEGSAAVDKLTIALDGMGEEAEETIQHLRKLVEQGAKINFDAAKEKLDNFLNEASIQQFSTNVVNGVASIGQLASGISSLSGAFEILGDTSLSTGEKFTQLLTSIGMGTTLLVSSSKQLIDSTKGVIVGVATRTAAISALSLEEKQMQVAQIKNITLDEAEKLSENELTLAILEEKAARALLNPFILGGAIAIAAVTAAILIAVEAHRKELQQIKETNSAIIESTQARQEEIQAYEDTAKSLQTLVNEYKEGAVSQEEFLSQKTELLNALDAEGRAALNTANTWEEATQALSNYRAELAKQERDEAEKQARAAGENALIDAASGAGTYDTSTQTFSTKSHKMAITLLSTQLQGMILGGLGIASLAGIPAENEIIDENQKALKEIDSIMKERNAELSDVLDENGVLTLNADDPETMIAFVDAVDQAVQEGYKVSDVLAKQAQEIRQSDQYNTLLQAVETQKSAAESEAGATSGIDSAKTLEEGQKAYKKFTEDLIKNEGYTLQEANDAWVKYLNGLDTEIAEQMSQVQADFDTMTFDYLQGAYANGIDVSNWDYTKYAQSIQEMLQAQGLSEGIQLFTKEEWTQMLTSGMSDKEIANAVRQKIEDNFQAGFEGWKEKTAELASSMQSVISDAINGNLETGEDSEYAKISEEIETLIKYYPELTEQANTFNNTAIIGTEKWTAATQELQAALNDLEMSTLVDDMSDDVERLNDMFNKVVTTEERDENGQLKTEIQLVPDTEKFSEVVTEIMNDDYSINVEIQADIEDQFDNLVDSMENMDDMASKIGEDFIVSAEDITEIAEAYPGILEGYTDLGNGTIQLNEEIAKSAMAAASDAEIASTEELATKIENTNAELKVKRQHYQTIIEIAKNAQEGIIKADQAKTDIDAELNEIEQMNADDTAQNEVDDAADVANDSQVNAGIVSDNWGEAYQNMADSSAEAARAAINNAKLVVAAEKGEEVDESQVQGGSNVKKAYSGKSGQKTTIDTSTSTKKSSDTETDDDYWNRIIQEAQENIDAIDKEIASNDAMLAEATARLGSSVSKNMSVGDSTSNDSSSSSSSDEADTEEYLEREEDIYHNINSELDEIESKLSRIQEVEDHSWGASMQEALETENKLLDDQLDKLQEKKSLQESDLSSQQSTLSSYGFTFSSDGSTITNSEEKLNELYEEYNSMVDTYNSMSADAQDSYQSTLDAKKDSIDEIEEAIETYEDTYSDYQSTLDDLLDAHYEEIENAVKSFNNMIDVHLDLKEAEQEWNDFWYDVVEDVDDTDFGGKIAKSMSQLTTLVGLNGDVDNSSVGMLTTHLTETIGEVWKQINNADDGGEGSLFGDDTALAETTLTDYRDQLMEALTSAKEEIDNISETYLDMLDDAQDKIDDQVEGWEAIGDQIEHDVELIKLVSGEDSYEALNKQYETLHKNNLELINTQKQSQDFWKDQIDRYQELLANTEEGTKQWETYNEALDKSIDNYRDAVKDLNSTVEESIQNLQTLFENQMALINRNLDNSLSDNIGLDNLEKQWKLVNEQASRYYDNVERSYEMEGLEDEFDKAVEAANSNADAQARINELRETEIARLKDKNKLSQFDLDEVKARLEILKEQIALEEAQANKSNMRLRRDSQGNYTYQYTGNDEDIEDASEGFMSAKSEWYQLVKNRNLDLAQAIIDNRKNLADALEAIEQQNFDSDAAREQAKLEIIQRYTELEKDIVRDAEEAKKIFFDGTAQYFADVENNNILPQWDTTIEHLVDKWSNGGEESFTGAVNKGIADIQAAQIEFGEKTEEILNEAGVNYTDLYENGIDPTTTSLEKLVETNEEFAEELEETNSLLIEQENNLRAAEEAYNALKDAAVDAISAANEALNTLAETAVNAVSQVNTAISSAENAATNITNKASSYKSTGSGSTSTGGSSASTKSYSLVTDPNGVSGTYGIQDETGSYVYITGSRDAAVAKLEELRKKNISVSNNTTKIKQNSSTGKWYGTSNSSKTPSIKIKAYDTGGYTGEWSNGSVDGRLAFLHQKELVLNEEDTSNILAAVSAMRDIVSATPNYSGIADNLVSIGNAQAQILAQVGTGILQGIASIVTTNQDNSTRSMTVNADFSGVQSADAIYQALRELENYGMQESYSTAPTANRSY